jgi:hypothetical protein
MQTEDARDPLHGRMITLFRADDQSPRPP